MKHAARNYQEEKKRKKKKATEKTGEIIFTLIRGTQGQDTDRRKKENCETTERNVPS